MSKSGQIICEHGKRVVMEKAEKHGVVGFMLWRLEVAERKDGIQPSPGLTGIFDALDALDKMARELAFGFASATFKVPEGFRGLAIEIAKAPFSLDQCCDLFIGMQKVRTIWDRDAGYFELRGAVDMLRADILRFVSEEACNRIRSAEKQKNGSVAGAAARRAKSNRPEIIQRMREIAEDIRKDKPGLKHIEVARKIKKRHPEFKWAVNTIRQRI